VLYQAAVSHKISYVSWILDAKALDQRIRGLMEAGEFFVRTLTVSSEDPYKVADNLSSEALRIFEEVEGFRGRYSAVLPPGALAAIERFVTSTKSYMISGEVLALPGLKARLAPLAAFRAELEYHLSDRTVRVHRLSERAFQHLQRAIVADEGIARGWAAAFTKGETACEKLGAVHLLSHGLWTFKVSGAGEATDLVFPEPVNVRTAEVTAEAIVLTEWKIVRAPDQMEPQASQARKQAAQYAHGVLGGLELQAYRYLVLVSEDFVQTPEDIDEGGVRYRHVNIAVSPRSPSKGT